MLTIPCTSPHPAQRIISLAPDITEDLFAIGAGKQMVGVENNSDYPPAAQKVTKIGGFTGLDIERIATLSPDLIITWGHTFDRELAPLQNMGIPIFHAHYQQLSDIPDLFRQLGCLTGHVGEANQLAAHFNQQLQQLGAQYAQRPPVRVFYELNAHPLMTVNKQSWINDLIVLCGGQNIFADAHFIAPMIDLESVIRARPQVILDASTLNPDWIERATPRLLWGAKQLCDDLHSPHLGVADGKNAA